MRVALAGAGRIGEVHLAALVRRPEVSEVRVFDPDVARAEALARSSGAVVAPGAGVLLDGADALVIASPTPTHAALLDSAIRAGLPTFCEKPVAPRLAEVQELADRAARAGCPVQVGFHYRFDPALRALVEKASTASGPRLLRIRSTTEFAPSAEYLAGAGGLIADKLIHELDMVRWATGAEVLRVAAFPAGEVGRGSRFEEPVTAALVLELTGGGLATVWGGYRSVAGFDLCVEFESADAALVAGNRHEVADGPVVVRPGVVADFRDRFAAAYAAEIEAFLVLAQTGGPNPCDLWEAVRTQRLVVAAQTALRERRVVGVDDEASASGPVRRARGERS